MSLKPSPFPPPGFAPAPAPMTTPPRTAYLAAPTFGPRPSPMDALRAAGHEAPLETSGRYARTTPRGTRIVEPPSAFTLPPLQASPATQMLDMTALQAASRVEVRVDREPVDVDRPTLLADEPALESAALFASPAPRSHRRRVVGVLHWVAFIAAIVFAGAVTLLALTLLGWT